MCAAKITPVGEAPFYLGKGREVEGEYGFSRFSNKTQNLLRRVAVFGTQDGVRITNIFGKAPAEITLKNNGEVIRTPKKVEFNGIEIKTRPLRFQLADGSTIRPVSEQTYDRSFTKKAKK
jgi:hypothetical protein